MDKYIRTYWLGYLAGVINGVSTRTDVPDEVREICKSVVDEYKRHSDAWEKEA